MKAYKIGQIITILVLLGTFQAEATELFQCAAVLVHGVSRFQEGNHRDALYSLREVLGRFGPYKIVPSWEPARYSSEADHIASFAGRSVVSRLAGIDEDLSNHSNAFVRSYEIRGANEIYRHVKKIGESFYKALDQSKFIAGDSKLFSLGLTTFVFAATFFSIDMYQGAQHALLSVPLIALTSTLSAVGYALKNFYHDFEQFMGAVEQASAKNQDALLYYSSNIQMSEKAAQLVRRPIRPEDLILAMQVFPEAFSENPEVTLLLDHMLFKDSTTGELVLTTFYREWREPLPTPPRASANARPR